MTLDLTTQRTALLLSIALLLAGGCESSSCTQGSDCSSTVCDLGLAGGTCALECETDADCPGGQVCSQATVGGQGACTPPCGDVIEHTFAEDVGCDGDRFIPCETANGRACSACGCPGGQFCDWMGEGLCTPQAEVGGPCQDHVECASLNCAILDPSTGDRLTVGECDPPSGTPCTPGDGTCAFCEMTSAGGNCRVPCSGANLLFCPGTGQGGCWGAPPETWCHTLCTNFNSADPLPTPEVCADGYICWDSYPEAGERQRNAPNRFVCIPG